MASLGKLSLRLNPSALVSDIRREKGKTPIPRAVWYVVNAPSAGIVYRFPPGTLAKANYLACDLLVTSRHRVSFQMTLREGENGAPFQFSFSLLPQCSARLRLPLNTVDQNTRFPTREGALINTKVGGARVDLAQVDQIMFYVFLKSEEPVRWCMTDLMATAAEPPRLKAPVLPKGPLLDKLGQVAIWNWPGKSRSAQEVTRRLRRQLAEAPKQNLPSGLSRWGGWRAKRFAATGFFRTHHDGQRWWFADPDGYAFWSTGITCVFPDTSGPVAGIEKALSWLPARKGPLAAARDSYGGVPGVNYLKANLLRAFGPACWFEPWGDIALSLLRRWGFNTVGNWSEWQLARKAVYPYVRQLEPSFPNTPRVFRDFPDVFEARFVRDAAAFAKPLRETAADPALIGYFLMNEPGWGFASDSPAAGMMFATTTCACRREFAAFLRNLYGNDKRLSAAWGCKTSLAAIANSVWTQPLAGSARGDLEAFSTIMVQKLFDTLRAACRSADPHHLNLGLRYCSSAPPVWALNGMRSLDVFSINWYQQRVDQRVGEWIAQQLHMPLLVGEFQYGALDVGLPAAGLRRVRDQRQRGQAYRVYVEDAAAKPWCVGTHWFQFYDQTALGRFDGENFNIGFLDICNRPYELLARDARISHKRIYEVAAGKQPPYAAEMWYNARP